MKPIAFLRSAFKRKGKKKSSKTPLSVEPLLLVPPASPLLTPSFVEVTPALSLGFEYTHQDPHIPIIDRPATTEIKNWALLSPSTGLDLQGEHRSPPLLRSHDSPQNASTAVLNLEGQKPQHSLQPPLYLWSRPSSPDLMSPSLAKFASEPQIKKVCPSSLQQTMRRVGVQKKACVSSDVAEVIDEGSRDLEEIDTSTTDCSPSSEHISAFNVLVDSPSTTHAILDAPTSPITSSGHTSTFSVLMNSPSPTHAILDAPTSSITKPFVCTNSLSPDHPTQTPLRTESQLHGENLNLLQDTLASFPRPPPLKVKRRPQPLILLPTLTTDRLPPSPQVSSTNSTPLVTPLPTPRSPKSPNRPFHTVIPPRCSPPNTPLPTPPTSSAFLAPSDHENLPGVEKVLRTMHSTSELHDHWVQVAYPVHNSKSSTPPAGVFVSDNASRWCNKLDPALKSDYSSRETMEMPHQYPLYEPETQMQWGYAL